MSSLNLIAQSWYEYATGNQHTKDMMLKRLEICNGCPHKKQLNALGVLIVSSINQEGNLFKCGLCGCPLAAKVSHPSNICEAGKWSLNL